MTTTQNNNLIDNLIEIICEDNLLASRQRKVLIQTVLLLSSGKNLVSMDERCFLLDSIELKEKKINVPDPRFPEANNKWREEEIIYLKDALEGVPNDEIDDTLLWLAEGLGRTPFSVACMISSFRNLPRQWRDKYRKISNDIRRSNLTISEFVKQTHQNKW